MLIALSFASDLLRAGQTSTHTPQPVQSSTATWIVNFLPFHSGSRASADLNVSAHGSPMRRRPCCESWRAATKTHLPHWMQTCGSKRNFDREIALLQRAVLVGTSVARHGAHRQTITHGGDGSSTLYTTPAPVRNGGPNRNNAFHLLRTLTSNRCDSVVSRPQCSSSRFPRLLT